MVPEPEKTELRAEPQGDATVPVAAKELRLKQQVADVLALTPGGDQLDQYFGISSGAPKQPTAEALEGDDLINRLRQISQGEGGDLAQLLGDIGKHVEGSGADPDALRALMRRPKKDTGSESAG